MRTQNLYSALGLAAIALFSAPTTAAALTFKPLTNFTDSSFDRMIRSGAFTRTFTAESRFGNRSLKGTPELRINSPRNLALATGQQAWLNNQAYSFTLQYTGSQITYTVGNRILSANLSSPITDIYLRTHAQDDSAVFLDSLSLNGSSTSSLFSQAGDGVTDTDFLRISDISAPFTLIGQQKFSWLEDGSLPTGSKLAYQINVGRTAAIPTPALLPGLIGLGVAIVRYRKDEQTSQA